MDLFDNAVLSYPLFQGDMDVRIIVLANRMLLTRREHPCVLCCEIIPAGSRARAQSEVWRDDNKVMRFYVCPACCEAISQRDGGAAIDARLFKVGAP